MKKIRSILLILLFATGLGIVIYKYGFKGLSGTEFRERSVKIKISSLQEKAKKASEDTEKGRGSADLAAKSYFYLASAYNENHNWSPAIDAFMKTIGYGDSGARTHYGLAVAYANRGRELSSGSDINLAEKHYRRALEINPALSDARYGLAILLFYEKNERDEAVNLLKALIISDGLYYRADFALARFYYEDGNPALSLRTYENLNSKLEKAAESPEINLMKKENRDNISRLMLEMSVR